MAVAVIVVRRGEESWDFLGRWRSPLTAWRVARALEQAGGLVLVRRCGLVMWECSGILSTGNLALLSGEDLTALDDN